MNDKISNYKQLAFVIYGTSTLPTWCAGSSFYPTEIVLQQTVNGTKNMGFTANGMQFTCYCSGESQITLGDNFTENTRGIVIYGIK